MRRDTRQRKHAMAGLRAISGEQQMLGTLVPVISSGNQGLDAVIFEKGRMGAESDMLIECEEVTGPDYYPTDPDLQKWAHEEGSLLRAPRTFSEALLEKILRDVSAQKYAETILQTTGAFGVSPSSVSRKLVDLTAQKLTAFHARSLAECTPFALFLDTIRRGGETFLVALGVDLSGEKMALGFWQGFSENHEICEALFSNLEHRGLALFRRILFVTDGGSGLRKALRERFGKKLVHQRCAIHKSRNLQWHLATRYRNEAHQRLKAALELTHYAEARQMLLELESWLRTKNESEADSLR